MHLTYLDLSQLVVSPANMRAKRKRRDIADLIPSVRARGVLVPLLVRPGNADDMYEIVAGRRRYLAAKAVAEETSGSTTVPCAIMDAGDDAAALEASLIENIARVDPDQVEQWETFARLIRQGRSIDDIASTFGLPGATVRRVLALGNLLPRILALYRAEQIDPGTIRSLTMATKTQQREWLSLFDGGDGHAPTGRALKAWLFGGRIIPTSAALFDLAAYTAPIVADLFDEHSYFSDVAEFWSLQNKAIEEKKQAYLDDGWADVVLLTDGHWFDRWVFEKRAKQNGGRVYIAVGENGGVDVFEGYLPRKEAQRIDGAAQPPPTPVRPELTSPLRRYIDLHRHAAVRAALIEHPWLALRLLLTHAIVGSTLWQVKTERQYADKAETRESIAASRAEAEFAKQRQTALAIIGLSADDAVLVGQNVAHHEVFDALVRMSDADVLAIVPIVMGETLDASSTFIESLGCMLGVDMSKWWQADTAFFTLVRNREALGAMVAEVAGPETALANHGEPAKVLKLILRDCLAGDNSRVKVSDWAPRWLRFPSSSYLEGNAEPEAPAIEEGAKPIDDASADQSAAAA